MTDDQLRKSVDKLGKTNKAINSVRVKLSQLLVEKNILKTGILEELDKRERKSVKGKKFKAYLYPQDEILITDAERIGQWLDEHPGFTKSSYFGVLPTFEHIARIALKEYGEIIPGTDYIQTTGLKITKKEGR